LPVLPNQKIEKETPDLMGKLGMKNQKNRKKKEKKAVGNESLQS
jgi:hypothetical protein